MSGWWRWLLPLGLEPVLSCESASSPWVGTRNAVDALVISAFWVDTSAGTDRSMSWAVAATCPGRVPRHIRGIHGMPAAPRPEECRVRTLAGSPSASQSR